MRVREKKLVVAPVATPVGPVRVTTHGHTVFGDLFQTILPEGNVLEYGYDHAERLRFGVKMNLARTVCKAILDCSGKLDYSVLAIERACGEEFLKRYRRAVGRLLGLFYVELLRDLFSSTRSSSLNL